MYTFNGRVQFSENIIEFSLPMANNVYAAFNFILHTFLFLSIFIHVFFSRFNSLNKNRITYLQFT